MATSGFTLLELLVVIAVIGVLISIVVPAYKRVSMLGKQAKCAANLKSIGNAVQAFMTDNDDYLPDALAVPSDEQNDPDEAAAPIYLLLTTELKSEKVSAQQRETLRRQAGWPGEKYPRHEVFHCPSDHIREPNKQEAVAFETYFDREGTSYEWNRSLSGRRLGSSVLAELGSNASDISLMWDFEPFHDGRNRLQADMSVVRSAE